MIWFVASAFANGLTSHVTISAYALDDMADGELADILRRDDLWPILQNGTQFPDGGYPLGEAYAETAHWEPFQDRYLDWIRSTYDGDFSSEEAQEHVAFLMGLSSHGMGDQVFDSLYMERAYRYDAASDWATLSMDTSTDVSISALTGGQQVQETWIPYDPVISCMTDAGVSVSAETLDKGQDLTHIAIAFGLTAATSSSLQAQHSAEFPWAYAHILDEDVPGSPPWEGRVVAEYWPVRWARLHGEVAENEPIIYTFPQDGGMGHETDGAMVESRVTVVFSRGLVDTLVLPDFFTVEDADGETYPVTPSVFYRYGSHVVHLSSQDGWPENTDFLVTVHAGVPFIDGTDSASEYSFSFSTKPVSTGGTADSEAAECGCASSGGSTGPIAISTLLTSFMLKRRRAPCRSDRPLR